MGEKKIVLILALLGFLCLDLLPLCTAANVHHYSFIVSVTYDGDSCLLLMCLDFQVYFGWHILFEKAENLKNLT
jgi:hypothetical protein